MLISSVSLLNQQRELLSAKMYMLLISGIISALIGIILIIVGIKQGNKRIECEDGYISADAEIVQFDSRRAVFRIGLIPIIAKEYSPAVRYLTDGGVWVMSQLPYTMKISSEYKDYKRSSDNGEPLPIRYNPDNPKTCYYGSKKGFRIREAIYKFLVGALLIFIGVMLIRGHFLI